MKKISIQVKTQYKNFSVVLYSRKENVFKVIKNFRSSILMDEKISSFSFQILNV